MLRILIVGINYAPEQIGIGKFTAEMTQWLAERGHKIRVITAPPYYPAWQVGAGYSQVWYRRELVSGVPVWRCPLWVPSRPSTFKRILHLASFAITSCPITFAQVLWRPHVVLVLQPPLFCAPVAWLTARLSGAIAWMHIQDLELEAAYGLNLLKAGPVESAMRAVERAVTARFDRVSTITEPMRLRVERKGLNKQRTLVFPNWVDTELIYPSDRRNRFREQLGLSPEHIVALYAGSMGVKQGLEIILTAARALIDKPQLVFVLAGQGATYESLRRTARGQKNVKWLPLQPRERLNELLNLADVHLLPQRAGAADVMMPSKLGGMFASGRPVIATAEVGTELAKLVEGRGIVTKPEDIAQFCKACLSLAGDPQTRMELGRAARGYACEHFEKDSRLKGFETELLKLFAKPGVR